MIFSCGETFEVWHSRMSNWHPYFVLWPKTMGQENGKYQCVWLQTIQRKGTYYQSYGFSGWEYKLK